MLVTTARVSPEAKAFEASNNRLCIIEGEELKHLSSKHLNWDLRIDLPTDPRRAA
jgi:restriction endonuclease Mrr